MSELRWILLVAGVLLIGGIYLWGLRARRRATVPEHERAVRVEPARTVAVVSDGARVEPEVDFADVAAGEPGAIDADQYEEPAVLRATGTGRREPRIEPGFDGRYEASAGGLRHEPRLTPQDAPPPPPEAEEAPRAAVAEPRRPAAQRIVAVRVVAAPGMQFAGTKLLETILADGFTFGRYQIFHRLDATGRPVVSLASLKEPGTFDPHGMQGAEFRGVALFTVMPGPLPALRAFDELLVAARELAADLDGQLQDERGAPLSLQRLGQLREEVAEFERARGTAAGG